MQKHYPVMMNPFPTVSVILMKGKTGKMELLTHRKKMSFPAITINSIITYLMMIQMIQKLTRGSSVSSNHHLALQLLSTVQVVQSCASIEPG
jgi:hypothetical protein